MRLLLTDIFRTVVLAVGFTLAMMCMKFGWLAFRAGEGWRGWGLTSYALLAISPALAGLFRYGEPIAWLPTTVYAAGLTCGLIALSTHYRLSPEWARMRGRVARKGR